MASLPGRPAQNARPAPTPAPAVQPARPAPAPVPAGQPARPVQNQVPIAPNGTQAGGTPANVVNPGGRPANGAAPAPINNNNNRGAPVAGGGGVQNPARNDSVNDPTKAAPPAVVPAPPAVVSAPMAPPAPAAPVARGGPTGILGPGALRAMPTPPDLAPNTGSWRAVLTNRAYIKVPATANSFTGGVVDQDKQAKFQTSPRDWFVYSAVVNPSDLVNRPSRVRINPRRYGTFCITSTAFNLNVVDGIQFGLAEEGVPPIYDGMVPIGRTAGTFCFHFQYIRALLNPQNDETDDAPVIRLALINRESFPPLPAAQPLFSLWHYEPTGDNAPWGDQGATLWDAMDDSGRPLTGATRLPGKGQPVQDKNKNLYKPGVADLPASVDELKPGSGGTGKPFFTPGTNPGVWRPAGKSDSPAAGGGKPGPGGGAVGGGKAPAENIYGYDDAARGKAPVGGGAAGGGKTPADGIYGYDDTARGGKAPADDTTRGGKAPTGDTYGFDDVARGQGGGGQGGNAAAGGGPAWKGGAKPAPGGGAARPPGPNIGAGRDPNANNAAAGSAANPFGNAGSGGGGGDDGSGDRQGSGKEEAGPDDPSNFYGDAVGK
ncbi:hypothetical protein BDZ85DRAFT_251609 [Elsinoe ampelina]|uniref:Uncharacterized protein n=1 Tax=Elsinoe ampelina TaxID=302913 RepID=A0A6A6G646_9PEZI|nr:hypothetical protein BDZ85DRAFT_251609 [Elsinoe ampelina]